MGVFGDIRGFFGGSGSVFMIIVLAVADHLWGENVFNCPCGGYRVLYTSAFLVVPPVAIIIIDVSWSALWGTLRENCCCECDGNCKGTCGCCCRCGQCCKETCCDYKTFEAIVRITARPIIIAIIWLIFSCMEPKFGRCIFETKECDSEAAEHAATLRVATALAMLCLAALTVVGGILFLVCRSCFPCTLEYCTETRCYKRCGCCRRCIDALLERSESWTEHDDPDSHRELTRSLYTLGLSPGTVLKMRHEGLMDGRLLVHLSDDAINRLGHSISVGQLEILRVHKRDIRLVGWLLGENYSKVDVRKILDQAENLQTLGPVRDSLNRSNPVDEGAATALKEELREKKVLTETKGKESIGLGHVQGMSNPKIAETSE